MIYKYIKWGCLGFAFIVLIAAWFLLRPAPLLQIDLSDGKLGGLKNIEMIHRGHLDFSLKSESVFEVYPQISSFLATSLVTYYELSRVEFSCDLEGFGHVVFESESGQLDLKMNHLRLTNPVFIQFDSGHKARAKRIDVNLTTGHVKPVALQLSIDGHDVMAGSRAWQMN